MKKHLLITLLIICKNYCFAQEEQRIINFPTQVEEVKKLPIKENLWVFIMAGQSNMAGRGFVEPEDTIDNPRVIALTRNYEWVYAKEPLNCYEPSYVGLDCGLSFGRELVKNVNDSISIAVIHCAVGGSSIGQWLGDSLHREVRLLTNLKSRMDSAKLHGTIKGVLWHQGESDAHPELIDAYQEKLTRLIQFFRVYSNNDTLPFLIGELSNYAIDEEPVKYWKLINQTIFNISLEDNQTRVIQTADLRDKGDHLHFNSVSQREMGKRFAQKYLEHVGRHILK